MLLIPFLLNLWDESSEKKLLVEPAYVAAAAVAFCVLVFVATPVSGATGAEIKQAVRTQLRRAEAVEADYIDVTFSDGAAELTGRVDSLLAFDRAADIARAVEGVESVVNRLEILAPPVTDRDIFNRINAALAEDPAVEAADVTPAVETGEVTLAGTVNSRAEKRIAGRLARGVKGVQRVANELSIRTPVERSDAEIREDVRSRLDWDLWVDAGLIRVEVNDGAVELVGTVASAAERNRAYQLARVAGVERVGVNKLAVDPALRDEMRRGPAYGPEDPAAIAKAVRSAFEIDPRVSPDDITVFFEDGRLTLTGTVDNLQAKTAAARNAGNTAGVRRVRNLLKVRPPDARDDGDVAQAVREWLSWDPYVKTDDLTVSVQNGKVFLRGEVRTRFEKERAEELAERARGAVDVANHLEARQPPATQKSDAELREAVRREIRWSPYVDLDQVTVKVQDGRVTLAGAVNSWRESHLAEKSAYEAGARNIQNFLDFEYGAL
ncbi:MAG: BON domain-containing protein [Desulfococcaceae bacterium]